MKGGEEMKQSIVRRRLAELAYKAAQNDDVMRELVRLAMYWEKGVGDIINPYFNLPSVPNDREELPKWKRAWNKNAKKLAGF
ncbi:MAG: hypothetical protein QMD92_00190 [bacterium]|nr:hypothetical protein [bacterium]